MFCLRRNHGRNNWTIPVKQTWRLFYFYSIPHECLFRRHFERWLTTRIFWIIPINWRFYPLTMCSIVLLPGVKRELRRVTEIRTPRSCRFFCIRRKSFLIMMSLKLVTLVKISFISILTRIIIGKSSTFFSNYRIILQIILLVKLEKARIK